MHAEYSTFSDRIVPHTNNDTREKRIDASLRAVQTMSAVGGGERKMPKLRCPHCGTRLLDAANVRVRRQTRLYLYRGEQSAQFVIKCRSCDSAVGIESSNG